MTTSEQTEASNDRRPPDTRPPASELVRPAWRTLAPVWSGGPGRDAFFGPKLLERLRPLDPSTDRNTDAEYNFYHLHGRVQRWAEEYFFADERLLAFVPWTAATTESRRSRFARRAALVVRQASEGALVVTDQQTMFLRDDAEPASGMIYWGYTARAIPHERLDRVEATSDGDGRVRLRLTLRAGNGSEQLGWTFSPPAEAAARETAELLRGFLPRQSDQRPRRLGRIRPLPELFVLPPPAPGRAGRRPTAAPVPPADLVLLEAGLQDLLHAHPAPNGTPRQVHARGICLGAEFGAGPRLLVVTQAYLACVDPPGHGEPSIYPLDEVTSAELRRSVLGLQIAWNVGRGARESPRRVVADFTPPSLTDCLAIFAALRQALTLLPVHARGPDLSIASPVTDSGLVLAPEAADDV